MCMNLWCCKYQAAMHNRFNLTLLRNSFIATVTCIRRHLDNAFNNVLQLLVSPEVDRQLDSTIFEGPFPLNYSIYILFIWDTAQTLHFSHSQHSHASQLEQSSILILLLYKNYRLTFLHTRSHAKKVILLTQFSTKHMTFKMLRYRCHMKKLKVCM